MLLKKKKKRPNLFIPIYKKILTKINNSLLFSIENLKSKRKNTQNKLIKHNKKLRKNIQTPHKKLKCMLKTWNREKEGKNERRKQ